MGRDERAKRFRPAVFQSQADLVPRCSCPEFLFQGSLLRGLAKGNLSVAEFSGIAYICSLNNILGVVAQFG